MYQTCLQTFTERFQVQMIFLKIFSKEKTLNVFSRWESHLSFCEFLTTVNCKLGLTRRSRGWNKSHRLCLLSSEIVTLLVVHLSLSKDLKDIATQFWELYPHQEDVHSHVLPKRLDDFGYYQSKFSWSTSC